MARCTAPVRGHHSAAAAADCPACGGRYGKKNSFRVYGSGYSDYGSYSSPSYSSGRSSTGGSGRRTRKPRWSGAGSATWYTPEQVQALAAVRENIENLAVSQPDLRDVFLCHAWDDRQASARELHDLLEERGVLLSNTFSSFCTFLVLCCDVCLVQSGVGAIVAFYCACSGGMLVINKLAGNTTCAALVPCLTSSERLARP